MAVERDARHVASNCPVPRASAWELCWSSWKDRFGSRAVTVLPVGWVSCGAGQGLVKLPVVILTAATGPEWQGN